MLTNLQYFELCDIIISDQESFDYIIDDFDIRLIDVNKLDSDQYYNLCFKTIINTATDLLDVDNSKLSYNQYYKLCEYLITYNTFNSLMCIKSELLNDDDYYKFCEIGVKNCYDDYVLKCVDINKMSIQNYLTLAEYSINMNIKNMKGINTDIIENYNSLYIELCYNIIKNKPHILEYININNIYNNKIYYDLCELAIICDSMVLKYIDNINNVDIYYKLCNIAVKNNGVNLQYVDFHELNTDDTLYYNLCEIAISNSGLNLEYIKINPNETNYYYCLCELAVNNNGLSLQFVKENELDKDKYYDLCKIAINNNSESIKYVVVPIMYFDNINNVDIYYKLCKASIVKCGDNLQFINVDYIDKYYDLCKIGVNNIKEMKLLHIKDEKLTKSEYYDICMSFINFNCVNLAYIKIKNLTTMQYYNLCELSINKEGSSICYLTSVEIEFIGELNYYNLCMIAINENKVNLNCIKSQCLTPELYTSLLTIYNK